MSITTRLQAKWARAARLGRDDWLFLAVAVAELAIARLRHARLPIAAIVRDLRSGPDVAQSRNMTDADLSRLSWAIAAAGNHVPWRSDCLLRAMAAHRWLCRKGVRTEVFFGVRKDDQGALLGHAWLRKGELTITGASDDEFEVLLGPSDDFAP